MESIHDGPLLLLELTHSARSDAALSLLVAAVNDHCHPNQHHHITGTANSTSTSTSHAMPTQPSLAPHNHCQPNWHQQSACIAIPPTINNNNTVTSVIAKQPTSLSSSSPPFRNDSPHWAVGAPGRRFRRGDRAVRVGGGPPCVSSRQLRRRRAVLAVSLIVWFHCRRTLECTRSRPMSDARAASPVSRPTSERTCHCRLWSGGFPMVGLLLICLRFSSSARYALTLGSVSFS